MDPQPKTIPKDLKTGLTILFYRISLIKKAFFFSFLFNSIYILFLLWFVVDFFALDLDLESKRTRLRKAIPIMINKFTERCLGQLAASFCLLLLISSVQLQESFGTGAGRMGDIHQPLFEKPCMNHD